MTTLTSKTEIITPLDMADAYRSARFDAWSGWVDENEWAHGVAESREHVAGELLLEAGLTEEETREGVHHFGEVDAQGVLADVCDYIAEHAKTVEVTVDVDEDDLETEEELLEIEALRLAEELLEGVPTLKLIGDAVRDQLAPELPSVIAATVEANT